MNTKKLQSIKYPSFNVKGHKCYLDYIQANQSSFPSDDDREYLLLWFSFSPPIQNIKE